MGSPSFSLKFPTFNLTGAWHKTLYGDDDGTTVAVESSRHSHPSLDLNVELSPIGEAKFDAPDWNLITLPPVTLEAPKLLQRKGLHVVRGEDGEIGLSFDNKTSRQFFVLGRSPSFPEFSLKFKVIPPYANSVLNFIIA